VGFCVVNKLTNFQYVSHWIYLKQAHDLYEKYCTNIWWLAQFVRGSARRFQDLALWLAAIVAAQSGYTDRVVKVLILEDFRISHLLRVPKPLPKQVSLF
jgi:hypothetical protein